MQIYTRSKGTAERYTDPSGSSISRRKFDELKNKGLALTPRTNNEINRLAAARARQLTDEGKTTKLTEIKKSTDFQKFIDMLKHHGQGNQYTIFEFDEYQIEEDYDDFWTYYHNE